MLLINHQQAFTFHQDRDKTNPIDLTKKKKKHRRSINERTAHAASEIVRFGGILPNGKVNLDTRLNTELVKEVITVLHASLDKKLDLLIAMLMSESEELDDLQARKAGAPHLPCVLLFLLLLVLCSY